MAKARVVRIARTGGPEVLEVAEVDVPAPGAGEVVLRQTAVGLNYIDINHRRGSYTLPSLPMVIGMEGAGVVEAVGSGVTRVAVGDRAGYAMVLGGYADRRIIKADRLDKLPAGISEEVAAAAMLQGLTAQYLVRDCYPIKRGDTVLVQAAAGGVGLMLCQWAKHLGATVIGTVGTDEKAAYARRFGCDHPIVYTRDNFVERVKEITKGAGVQAVYDAVGKDTWEGSFACLGDFGRMVAYGEASGPPPLLDTRKLGARAQSFSRGSLGPFSATPERRDPRAAELFSMIKSGALKIEINQRYKLAEAGRAQADMEGRRTTGSTVLLP